VKTLKKYRLIYGETRWAKSPEEAKEIFRKVLAKIIVDETAFDVETSLTDDETGEEF
jgi:hypothetical protein